MSDYFALIAEPRRPWLDADALKKKFLTLSAVAHPDRFHNVSPAEKESASQRFTELNAAYNCLREPKDRLRHLLELELGAKPKDLQEIPPDLADLFLEVAQLRQTANGVIAGKSKAISPMLQVQWFERAQEETERLSQMQRRLNERQSALLVTLHKVDSDWESSASNQALLPQLEEIYRLLSFHSRWSLQLQEAIVQLAF